MLSKRATAAGDAHDKIRDPRSSMLKRKGKNSWDRMAVAKLGGYSKCCGSVHPMRNDELELGDVHVEAQLVNLPFHKVSSIHLTHVGVEVAG